MVYLKNILRETKTRFYQSLANKRVLIKMERPIISITFDDVPRSVLDNGIPLLNSHNIKATFYVAMGLSNTDNKNTDISKSTYLSPDDVLDLHSSGHDIACHTYSHYMLNKGTANGLALDARKNLNALTSTLGPIKIDHFSYPFGQVNFKLKSLLARDYKTMRSSRPGVNFGATDLYLLRATSIYNPTFNKDVIKACIEKTERYGGWLILYTHGVENRPDNYSCTPDQLAWVIRQCIKSTAQILPVSEAYTRIVSNF